jgi:hypothetical protein
LLLEHRDLSDIEYESFLGAKNELTNVYKDEVIYWQQQARIQWLSQGDANTKIFHFVAFSRKYSNLITSLKIDEVETREPLILEKHVF